MESGVGNGDGEELVAPPRAGLRIVGFLWGVLVLYENEVEAEASALEGDCLGWALFVRATLPDENPGHRQVSPEGLDLGSRNGQGLIAPVDGHGLILPFFPAWNPFLLRRLGAEGVQSRVAQGLEADRLGLLGDLLQGERLTLPSCPGTA